MSYWPRVVEAHECPRCAGDGRVGPPLVTCPLCAGTGLVSKAVADRELAAVEAHNERMANIMKRRKAAVGRALDKINGKSPEHKS